VQIKRDDEAKRVIPLKGAEDRLDSSSDAGPVPVAAVQDLILIKDDWLLETIRLDVFNERGRVVEKREDAS
jgi:hypothetical protein